MWFFCSFCAQKPFFILHPLGNKKLPSDFFSSFVRSFNFILGGVLARFGRMLLALITPGMSVFAFEILIVTRNQTLRKIKKLRYLKIVIHRLTKILPFIPLHYWDPERNNSQAWPVIRSSSEPISGLHLCGHIIQPSQQETAVSPFRDFY